MINIPLSKPIIGKEEKHEVMKVMDSAILAQGRKVLELEKKFSSMCGSKYSLAINNGTAALHTALYAVGIGVGDEVITTPFTFVATANSILMCGAKPVFVDIDEKTYNIDPDKIEPAITKKTKAILVVNLYGLPADYDRIVRIARKHNLLIVEDAAQSVGAKYKNKISGNLADISCFSLYATKNIMSGEGGMITTNSKKYYEKAKLFRHHGQDQNKRYYYSGLGYNYRMTDIQAAIALVQLKRLPWITEKRQQNAKIYSNSLVKHNNLITPYIPPDRTHVYHQYTIRFDNQSPITRKRFQDYLNKLGIQTNIYYPVPLYKFRHLTNNAKIEDFPVTEKLVKQVVSLPIHPLLKKEEITYIVKAIQTFSSSNNL